MTKVTGYFPVAVSRPDAEAWSERKAALRVIYDEFNVSQFGERRRLRTKLRPITARYISARATWEATPEKKDLREWLERVSAASADLAKLLSEASDTARAIVHDGEPWGRIEAQMLVVSNRAQRGILGLPNGTGREKDGPFVAFVADVAKLYTDTRGERGGC
jgi:hypothetical protein